MSVYYPDLSAMEKNQKVLPASLCRTTDHSFYRFYHFAGTVSRKERSVITTDSLFSFFSAFTTLCLTWYWRGSVPALLSLGWERACARKRVWQEGGINKLLSSRENAIIKVS